MKKTRNALFSLGAAIATTKLAHTVLGLGLDDVLQPLGLARRRRNWPGNLALVGAGLVAGGALALLLAPASGEETRARVAKKVGELGDVALNKVRDVSQELRQEVSALSELRDNGSSPRSLTPT
jgi:hypothetical protein